VREVPGLCVVEREDKKRRDGAWGAGEGQKRTRTGREASHTCLITSIGSQSQFPQIFTSNPTLFLKFKDF
jgi:hypothetical protein